MWRSLKRICKDRCQFVFFTTTKFGYKIIESNPTWFRYDLVWEKYIGVGFLSANKMPLRSHEMIYIFSSQNTDDVELSRNLEMREYAKQVLKFINKTSKQIERELGHRKAEHFLQRVSTSQFSLPTEKTYNELIEKYNIDTMEGYIKFEDMKKNEITYNPQKTPGKPYKCKEKNLKNNGYEFARIHWEIGKLYLNKEGYYDSALFSEAKNELEKASMLGVDSPEFHSDLASAYQGLNLYEKAIKEYEKAYEKKEIAKQKEAGSEAN